MDPSTQVKTLNELLNTCTHAEKSYAEAAGKTHDEQLKSLFLERSRERGHFASQIKAEINRLDGGIDHGDPLAARINRTWMDLRAAFSGNDDASILKEAKRGEENALQQYQEALDELPIETPAYTALVDQRNSIRSLIERLDQLLPIYEQGED